MQQRRAIIDIGSNTVRLVIYDGPLRAPIVLYNEKVTARLGKGVAEDGRLTRRGTAVALAALARYAALLRLQGIEDVQTVATAAVRDANNGGAFLAMVRQCGLDPLLLSGEEEALASARGVMGAFPRARGVVGDLGGGSLELTDIDGSHCRHGTSLPLGSLRLTQMRAGGPARFTRKVHRLLSAADWSGGHAEPFYLVGGPWRALGRYALRLADWPIDDPHGFEITPEAALTLARTVGQGRIRPDISGISSGRLAAMPNAAALLGVLVRELGPSRLVFSGWGLREGLLMGRLGSGVRSQDPLLVGVTAFAQAQGTPIAAATMVAGWTAEAIPVGGAGRENLRLAATLLALASARVEPNLRSQLALEWALRKRWIGIDAQGRAMLAAAGLANTGQTAMPSALDRLAPPEALREGVAWGLAVRLARRFTAATPRALAGSTLTREGARLVMAIAPPLHALRNDAVDKDLSLLAQWLGLEGEMRLAENTPPT